MYLEGQYMMNPRGRVPFKWMSPEALFDLKFTTKSDVWVDIILVAIVLTSKILSETWRHVRLLNTHGLNDRNIAGHAAYIITSEQQFKVVLTAIDM